jgi:lipopolysaccharide/colanic/teichoic acid biosynthesis glycosyltransferase
MYKLFFKRFLDLLISIIGLLVIFPVFIIVYIMLLFANNGKAFFLQNRPGKNGKIFKIYKFKTMNDKTDEEGKLLDASLRLTKTGIFLRKYSLDEIPQLINVMKGEMSIIGPRPLLTSYLPLYNAHQMKRHNIKPGITGWAQVNGRNTINWEQKFDLDIHYVNNITFMFDIKIFILTILKVFKKEGVYTNDDSIMPEFKGSKKRIND